MKPLFLLVLGFEPYWLVPVVGAAACGLAFLLGRRYLTARPVKPTLEPDGNSEGDFLKGVTQDRRATPRRKGNQVEVQLAGNGTTLRGWVLDRSQGGLGLLVEQPVAEGAALKVRPSAAGPGIPWTEVTVRSCRQEGHQFELGCQFDHMPNYSQLLQFG